LERVTAKQSGEVTFKITKQIVAKSRKHWKKQQNNRGYST